MQQVSGLKLVQLLELSFPSKKDGDISFTLKSKPGINTSATISASVLTTDLTNLANTINNYSGEQVLQLIFQVIKNI